jgi:hypothetical protein
MAGWRNWCMTNSDFKPKATALLNEVLQLTEEAYLHLRIDEPIEKAAAGFEAERVAPMTHKAFVELTSAFVHHVYEHGLSTWQGLSDAEARAEAIAILEEGYQGAHGRGYYTAFLDASNPGPDGVEFVLARMADLIILRARETHIRWVFATRIELLDWPKRRVLAETLFKRWEPFLGPGLLRLSPARLAHHLPELITAILSNRQMVGKQRERPHHRWMLLGKKGQIEKRR